MNSCVWNRQPARLLASCALILLAGQTVEAADPDWHTAPGCRWRELPVPTTGKIGFTLLSPEQTGINFTNQLSDIAAAQNRILQNGSGVALGDVDGDGWCDIYFCRLEGPNALYRNLANGRFEDIARVAGVDCEGQFSTGAVLADIDGDGDLDLLVNCVGGGTRSFVNDSRGHFTEVRDTRLVRRFGSTSLALADIDGDGDLDLYVANYRAETYKDIPGFKVEARMVDGKVVVTPSDRFFALAPRNGAVEVIERGERDFLYLNDGKGNFAPVSWTSGAFLDEEGKPLTAPPTDWGLSVMFRDINGDGLPDIYVCNDFFHSPDRVWLNESGRSFRAIPRLALRNMSASSMAIDFADIDRDGFDDFFVAEMLNREHQARQRHRENIVKREWNLPLADPGYRPEVPRNTLQLNRGDGTFAEVAQLSGVAQSDWTWSALFLDVDLDGYEDLLMATGHHYDVQDTDTLRELSQMRERERGEDHLRNLRRFPRLDAEKLAFRNLHDLTFAEAGRQWGFDAAGVSQGMALADLDNDGDLDVIVNNLNEAAGIYRNESTAPRVAVRLKGQSPNTRGIGAKIWLYGGAAPVQGQEMICGGRYLSSDDPMRVFAAGSLTNEMRIEVKWRSGKRSVVNGVRANRVYEIDEAGAEGSSKLKAQSSREAPSTNHQSPIADRQSPITNHESRITNSPPVFEDVSGLIHHVHHEEPYDDFERQPLLPRKLSQLGPGVAWGDVDGDGWDDLIVGSGRGGRLAVYRNDRQGGFQQTTGASLDPPLTRDQTGLIVWHRTVGQTIVFAGSANYEDGQSDGSGVRQYDLARHLVDESLGAQESSTGPLALAYIHGGGHCALFVGGRVIPGRYPEPASSRIYRHDGTKFQVDPENTKTLARVGLVSGAVWSDLDGDGYPELILACEWGPVRIFRNQRGHLVAWDAPVTNNQQPATDNQQKVTLNQITGCWNGVSTGDFDGDGRMDIVAANWGRNTKYQRYLDRPAKIFYGDFNRAGKVAVVEAFYDPDSKKVVPWPDLDALSRALPFVLERFPTCRAYSTAGVLEVLGTSQVGELSASTLDSMIFLNRGGRFEPKPLPPEAQFAPAFAVCVGDYDGDGNEDIFLSQNFFDVDAETSRYDAGVGLWLRGDGRGNFQAVPGRESGVRVFGEQRGAALCDYDKDGRVDLVVTQNGGETKLYHNARGKPGIRVRLKGPVKNPSGIGAVVRLKFGDRYGPARELHAGSGYWSQDSAVLVLGTPESPSEIRVRWPGGQVTTSAITEKAAGISIDSNGKLEVIRMSER